MSRRAAAAPSLDWLRSRDRRVWVATDAHGRAWWVIRAQGRCEIRTTDPALCGHRRTPGDALLEAERRAHRYPPEAQP